MSTIVVTGAAGFIGHNLVKRLNEKGFRKIILVDSLSKKGHYKNLIGLSYIDIFNFEKGLDFLKQSISDYDDIEAVFHIGANADVLIDNCNIMMDMNFDHSKFWFQIAKERNIPFIYASSSAVYGNSESFKVCNEDEAPHNEYAFSKLAFDNYVRSQIEYCKNKITGYRFFNVFGLGEFHKGKNASLPYRFFNSITQSGYIDLFDKKIERDYISVDDICDVLIRSWQLSIESGIYNLGSGNSISHEKLASLVVDTMAMRGLVNINRDRCIQKIEMPEELINKFQYFTLAEELQQWVLELTKNNEEKIVNYIEQLCIRGAE